MVYQNYLVKILIVIAVITVLSGLTQMLFPALVLGVIGGEITGSTNHFFGIVGMFMVLFGGLLIHVLRGKKPQPVPVLWCGLQKFGAAIAVTLGIGRGLFSWLAFGVAAFDLFSGVLIMIYWFSAKNKLADQKTAAL